MKGEGRKVEIGIARTAKTFFLTLSFMFIFFVFLCSCSTIPENSQSHIIENVPFYAQTSYQCGPASLAGVLNYWGIKVTPDKIAEEIYSASARGTLDIDMVLYARRKGLLVTQYEGTVDDLRKNIDSRHPLIVLVDYGFSFVRKNHFIVVIGYNDHGVIVNSGKKKGKFVWEKDFVKSWEKTKFWTLLISKNREVGNENY
jgi:ABC-type bacteriocin/lantibiotic exporter with double-glycine peptidase domain